MFERNYMHSSCDLSPIYKFRKIAELSITLPAFGRTHALVLTSVVLTCIIITLVVVALIS